MAASRKAGSQKVDHGPGIGACWLGDAAVFGFGGGTLLIGGKVFRPHKGGIIALALSHNGQQVITCGEDGRVVATTASGDRTTLFERKGAWLECLTIHPETGKIAVICGREVLLLNPQTPEIAPEVFKPTRAPNSIAISGDGELLAIGHSAGVSLFRTNLTSEPWFEFPCNGGPISVALSPNGGFLFAGLSEPALAGWRIADGQGFRMGGYPGKPRQLTWSQSGRALLTSGGPALLVWPMVGKDGASINGPMGQAASVYRPRLGLVTAIASHNEQALVGWSDGGVDLVNMADGQFRHIGGPRPKSDLRDDPRGLTTTIVAASFRSDGKQASWISETGAYGTAAVQ